MWIRIQIRRSFDQFDPQRTQVNIARQFHQVGVFLAQDGFIAILVCQLIKICFIVTVEKIGDEYPMQAFGRNQINVQVSGFGLG
jgi:hypothetical protein